MKNPLSLVLIAFGLLLSACGGGGGYGGDDDSTPYSPPPPPPPSVENPSGFWIGQVTGGGITNDASCLIASTLEIACVSFDPITDAFAVTSTGTVSVTNGNQVSGSGTSYAPSGFVFADGSSVASFTITSGTVSERSTISLTTDAAGTINTVSGTFDAAYDRDSSLAKIAGVYSDFFIAGTVSSFSIDVSGVIFAQTATGCVGNGQVSILDSQFNEYDVQLTVSSCPGLNGTYNGLGITSDAVTTDDMFLLAVFTSTIGIVAAPIK